MEHSDKFEEIKSFYKKKLWPVSAVKMAVRKKLITADEFKEITGKEYQ